MALLSVFVFDSNVKSWQYFHIDNISLQTMVNRWLSGDVVSLEIEAEVYEKFAKYLTAISRRNHGSLQPSLKVNIAIATRALPVARLFCSVRAIFSSLRENLA